MTMETLVGMNIMCDAPELIFGFKEPDQGEVRWTYSEWGHESDTEYVRRDLFDAMQTRAEKAEGEVDRLSKAVISSGELGEIIGFLGSDVSRINAVKYECGDELLSRLRTALRGGSK